MRKTQYTKVIVTITTILFILVLLVSFAYMFFITFMSNNSGIIDYVVFATAISMMGTIYGFVVKNYMKKSTLENVAAIRKSSYREVMNTRLKYDEQILRLKQKYKIEQSIIDEIENNAQFKDLSENVITQLFYKLDTEEEENDDDIII